MNIVLTRKILRYNNYYYFYGIIKYHTHNFKYILNNYRNNYHINYITVENLS